MSHIYAAFSIHEEMNPEVSSVASLHFILRVVLRVVFLCIHIEQLIVLLCQEIQSFKLAYFAHFRVIYLLNLHLMLTDEFSDIFLGDVTFLLLEPIGESNPLVLFLLQSACLLNLIDPRLSISGLHLNLVKGCESIGNEYLLIVVGNTEA